MAHEAMATADLFDKSDRSEHLRHGEAQAKGMGRWRRSVRRKALQRTRKRLHRKEVAASIGAAGVQGGERWDQMLDSNGGGESQGRATKFLERLVLRQEQTLRSLAERVENLERRLLGHPDVTRAREDGMAAAQDNWGEDKPGPGETVPDHYWARQMRRFARWGIFREGCVG